MMIKPNANFGYPATAGFQLETVFSLSVSYAAILSRILASAMCRINRRFLSTKASLSARQLSSNTPTAEEPVRSAAAVRVTYSPMRRWSQVVGFSENEEVLGNRSLYLGELSAESSSIKTS